HRVVDDVDAPFLQPVVTEGDRLDLPIPGDHFVTHETGVVIAIRFDQGHVDRRITQAQITGYRAPADTATDDDDFLPALCDRKPRCRQRQTCRTGSENEVPACDVRHDFVLPHFWLA